MMKKLILILFLSAIIPPCTSVICAEETIMLAPSAPYDRYIIYQNLVLFWCGIIGLIVIIRIKLKEIERIQRLWIQKEEKDIPVLD